ncbi:putative uncharacterized protein [Burkholderiales bacterium GJ-E10]|nr:putative uncharacterized protein [Burkholderiales bacterium GJ-E10]
METVIFSSKEVRELTDHLGAIMKKVPLHPIKTEAEHDQAVRVLNGLLDSGAADEAHPLAPLAAALGDVIADFADMHHEIPEASPPEVLRELMAQHGLKQTDVPEIGSQGVVSEILSGKRELNARQIAELSRRFHVSPAVFFEATLA